jgi:hypothetical protein
LYRPSFSLPVRLSSGVNADYWAQVPLLDFRQISWSFSTYVNDLLTDTLLRMELF